MGIDSLLCLGHTTKYILEDWAHMLNERLCIDVHVLQTKNFEGKEGALACATSFKSVRPELSLTDRVFLRASLGGKGNGRAQFHARLLGKRLTRLVGSHGAVNLQRVSPSLCLPLAQVDPAVPVIVSFWGSDLLRPLGSDGVRLQRIAVRRANVVTMQSADMMPYFIRRFGAAAQAKVVHAKYPMSDHEIAMLRAPMSIEESRMLQELGVKETKLVVVVGHSGHEANRQLEVLAALRIMPPEVLNRVQVIFPMTYGAREGYVERVRDSARSLGLDALFLDEYLSRPQIVAIRKRTDFFVHVPVSDAFSKALTETLIAGGRVFTGSWLPYQDLRNIDEVVVGEDIFEVVRLLTSTLSDVRSREQLGRGHAADSVFNIVSSVSVAKQWRSVVLLAEQHCRLGSAM